MPSWPRGLWADLPKTERRALRAALRDLEALYGPFRRWPVRTYAQLAVETGWTAQEASGAAIAEAVKRRHGRGRRPSRPSLDRRMKRQGLSVETFDKLVGRLEALAGRNGHGDLAARFAAHHREAGRA